MERQSRQCDGQPRDLTAGLATAVQSSFAGVAFARKELRASQRRGAISRALLLLALALCLVFVACFGHALTEAEANRRRYRLHLSAGEAPHDFRPSSLPWILDWLALGGLVGAFLAAPLALARGTRDADDLVFCVGNSSRSDHPMELPMAQDIPLVQVVESGLEVTRRREWIVVDDSADAAACTCPPLVWRESAIHYGCLEASLPAGRRLLLQADEQTFSIEPSRRARPLGTGSLVPLDARSLTILASTAALVFGFVGLLGTLRAEEDRSALATLTELRIRPALPRLEPRNAQPARAAQAKQRVEVAIDQAKSASPAGKERERLLMSTPKPSREEAVSAARKAGVPGILASQPFAFEDIAPSASFSLDGSASTDYATKPLPSEDADWGYGISAAGPGAGGAGWGTIGRGNYGHLGTGSHRSFAEAPPLHGCAGCTQVPSIPLCIGRISGVSTSGADGHIRRVLRQRIPKLQGCYKEALGHEPKLHGKVRARFQLSPLGRVQGVTVEGVGDASLRSCVADQIRETRFPRTTGGTYLDIRYEFNLSPPSRIVCALSRASDR